MADALLRVRVALRGVRRRSDLPLPLGGPLPSARRRWARRSGGLRRDPGRRSLLRVEEGRLELVLSAPRPRADLAAVREQVASRLGKKARVSTLHDMLVIDVDRDRLVEAATFLRDDPRTRCDLYSVNAGVDTGAELRSVTFVRGTVTKVFAMVRTTCTELDPHVPSLTGVWEGANWCERETYDMFGVEFDGHPDLRWICLGGSFPENALRNALLLPSSMDRVRE